MHEIINIFLYCLSQLVLESGLDLGYKLFSHHKDDLTWSPWGEGSISFQMYSPVPISLSPTNLDSLPLILLLISVESSLPTSPNLKTSPNT